MISRIFLFTFLTSEKCKLFLAHTLAKVTTNLSLFSDNTTVENLRAVCLDHAKLGENSLSPSLDSRFFGPSPSQVLYLIEVRDCLSLTLSF